MEEEENSKSGVIWNFDDAVSQLVFSLKAKFLTNIQPDIWDLEKAYWVLWIMNIELKALFEEPVKEELNTDFDELTYLRNATDGFKNLNRIQQGMCAEYLAKFYEKICQEAVDKQYYFRKKKEYVGL